MFHEFTLVIAGISDIDDDVINALFEAGCDDATISKCDGRIGLDFSRQASNLFDAIQSAIKDIETANIGARIVEVIA